jgi:hypothetical protein
MIEIKKLERKKGFYYLATPYSKWVHGLHDANLVAQRLAGALIKAKIPVYSPIAHTHGIAIAANMNPMDHKIWMPADKPIFDAAYGLLIADLKGWRDSKGVAIEIEWAKEQLKPIWVLNPVTLDLKPLKR